MELEADKNIRSRLISRGVKSLTDSELLSLFLVSDRPHEMADELLASFDGSLGDMSAADITRLRMSAGLGVRNAATLMAAIEIGRRVSQSQSNTITSIRSNDDVIDIFRPLIGQLPHEEMWAIYLSSANTIIDKVRVSQGGVATTIFDHKIIVKRAVELLAVGVILVHNHPSGNVTPSDDDRANTSKVLMAASLFDICLLDHIIISASGSFSFRREGLLAE